MSDEDDSKARIFAPVAEYIIAAVGWIAAAIAALLSLIAIGSIASALHPGNIVTQSGQRDLIGAAKLSVALLVPVWILAHLPLIGGIACSSGEMGIISTVFVGGIQLVALVFVGKGMLRAMWTLSTGDPDLGDSALSIGAGILPIVGASFITIQGSSLLTCLYP